MAELVDDGIADFANGFAAVARDAENRAAKDRHLIGEKGHAVRTLGERDAAIDPEELVVIVFFLIFEKLEILSIANIVANAISAIFEDTSVSSIFSGENLL